MKPLMAARYLNKRPTNKKIVVKPYYMMTFFLYIVYYILIHKIATINTIKIETNINFQAIKDIRCLVVVIGLYDWPNNSFRFIEPTISII